MSMKDWNEALEKLRRQFRREFRDGGRETKPGSDIETSSIDVSYFDPHGYHGGIKPDDCVRWHGAQIQVHGDNNLADLIRIWLSSEPNAYAVNEPGGSGLLADTVHTTRRAAIVNWLCTHKGVLVTNTWSDGDIEFAWRSMRDDRTFCIKVHIFAAQGADANVTERHDA
jgi:hypothetical protein